MYIFWNKIPTHTFKIYKEKYNIIYYPIVTCEINIFYVPINYFTEWLTVN